MNGKEAERILDSLTEGGSWARLSAPGRTKVVVYQSSNGRTLAVIPESATAKLVFERSPDGTQLPWHEISDNVGAVLSNAQLATSGLKVQEAKRLAHGQQQVLELTNEAQLRQVVGAYLSAEGSPSILDPASVSRWIERLRAAFPGLDSFNKPDPAFDMAERSYKLESAAALDSALHNVSDNREFLSAVVGVLSKSNLLQWRAYWSMSPKGDGDLDEIAAAVRKLAEAAKGPANGHSQALSDFVETWMAAVPKGQRDHARQIGEFLLMHLSPDEGVYIRHSVRADLWREGYGISFPGNGSLPDIYSKELQFMRDVRRAFEERGLAPRDMIDVQSALWVIHNFKADENGKPASALFSRDVVEGAMDAYDQYRNSQHHNEIFDSFGEPRDYWVRSTLDRQNRVYPSKPIIGFILDKTVLNGGWGQKGDAAARLHNSGFIIVDQDDRPLAPPDQYDHLLRGRARAQLCAANYYIEPAKESGAAEVSIRAGDLKTVLGLGERTPTICAALEDEHLQRLTNVRAPSRSNPEDSRNTVFTFQLPPHEEHHAMNHEALVPLPSATNLILYGPPGTGKTYATAWEAVRLCLGETAAEPLRNDRDALMTKYRRLAGEGQIEFVTFHQSMSYEEFVEGLRPDTGEDSDLEITESGTGFRLKPHDGVFKRISERARLDAGQGDTAGRLDRSVRVFKVALGRRHTQEDRVRFGLENSLIHVGWGGDIDWSDERYDELSEILTEWRAQKEPEANGHNGNVVITWSLRSDMQVGDYVVVSDGRDRIRAFGRVTGEYFYAANASFHPHRRRVEWIWHDKVGIERSRIYPNPFRQHSVYKLDQSLVDWDELETLVPEINAPSTGQGARDHVLIIDEVNRANISKVFGELITLLEPDKRLGMKNEIRLTLPYSKKSFGVPANLHIIGTMNTADRSIALLDTALRRRFIFRELMPDPTVLATNVDGVNLQKLLRTINERIEYLFDREHQIGHAYFTGCGTRNDVEAVMRHKVIPLLAEYFYEDWSKVAAVLGDTKQDKPRFLVREDLTAPEGMETDSFAGARQRWRVKPEQGSDGNGGFDFMEFEA